MTTVERDIRATEPVVQPEEIEREGVIIIMAHQNDEGGVEICLLKHKANPFKGIEDGELGLPSETVEIDNTAYPAEDPYRALFRLFREELGMENPLDPRYSLYTTPFCQTGFGGENIQQARPEGRMVNIMPYGLVMWTGNPEAVKRSFRKSQFVDGGELNDIGFYPIDRILSPESPLLFRTAPHAPTIVRQALDAGMLRHP